MGTTHIILDISGYFAPAAPSGLWFNPYENKLNKCILIANFSAVLLRSECLTLVNEQ